MKQRIATGLFTIVALISFSHSAAADYFCQGKITDVFVTYTGDTYIHGTWSNDYAQICRIDADWKGVSAEICKAWLSIAEIAQTSDADVIVRYDESAITSCSDIPSYGQAPRPYYLMLNK